MHGDKAGGMDASGIFELSSSSCSSSESESDFEVRGKKRKKPERPLKKQPAFQSSNEAQEFGAFEKHTTGIGSKLLMKMGFKMGSGLGKEGTGRIEPIEVSLRGKGSGLGFNDDLQEEKSENNTESPKYQMAEASKIKKKSWKKKNEPAFNEADLKVQQKRVDVIYDMTGPSTRIIRNLDEFSSTEMSECGNFPELFYNVQLLESRFEMQKLTVEKEIKDLKQEIMIAEASIQELDAENEVMEKKMRVIVEIMMQMKKVEKMTSNLDYVFDMFALIKEKYLRDFIDLDVAYYIYSIVEKQFKKLWSGWNISESFDLGLDLVKKAIELLNISKNKKMKSPYESLIEDYWFPPVRSWIHNEWRVKEPSILISFLEVWNDFISDYCKEELIDNMIIPRIERKLDDWSPKTDSVPVQTWIQPWLLLIRSDKLQEAFKIIRTKFTLALSDWHPVDDSALHVIMPWKEVFSDQEFDKLIDRGIIPRLVDCLATDLHFDPSNQNLEPLKWISIWEGIISTHQLIRVFEEGFFPSWLKCFHTWLTDEDVNYCEIVDWYLEWKKILPLQIVSSSEIKFQLEKALDMMNLLLDNKQVPFSNFMIHPTLSSKKMKSKKFDTIY